MIPNVANSEDKKTSEYLIAIVCIISVVIINRDDIKDAVRNSFETHTKRSIPKL